MIEQKINAAIDETEFELEKLGLKMGDYIYDARMDLRYIHGEVVLDEEEFGTGSGRASTKTSKGDRRKH